MKRIKTLSTQIKKELKDARHYADCTLHKKAEHRELADLYYELANEELSYADRLHGAVVKEIRRAKESGREAPAVMQEIWNWQHSEIMEETTEVKIALEMYRK